MGHARTLQTSHDLVHFLSQVVHGGLRGLFTRHSNRHVFPPELSQLGIVRHVGSSRRPGHTGRAAVELNQTTVLVGVLGEVVCADVAVTDEGQTSDRLLQRDRFAGHKLRIQPGCGNFVRIMVFEERP